MKVLRIPELKHEALLKVNSHAVEKERHTPPFMSVANTKRYNIERTKVENIPQPF